MINQQWKPDDDTIAQCDQVRIAKQVLHGMPTFGFQWCKDNEVLWATIVNINPVADHLFGRHDILKDIREYFVGSKEWKLVQGYGSDELFVYAKGY